MSRIPRVLQTHGTSIMEGVGPQHMWGFSPALDLQATYYAAGGAKPKTIAAAPAKAAKAGGGKKKKSKPKVTPLRVLVVGGGDIRHVLRTLAALSHGPSLAGGHRRRIPRRRPRRTPREHGAVRRSRRRLGLCWLPQCGGRRLGGRHRQQAVRTVVGVARAGNGCIRGILCPRRRLSAQPHLFRPRGVGQQLRLSCLVRAPPQLLAQLHDAQRGLAELASLAERKRRSAKALHTCSRGTRLYRALTPVRAASSRSSSPTWRCE